MEESKKFAKWLIICTQEVNTIGACRRYKGKVLNVDELYTAFKEYLYTSNQTNKKESDENDYNQALEDKKDKKYTEKDLLDAYTWGFLEGTERGDDVTDSVNKFSQSLHNKTE